MRLELAAIQGRPGRGPCEALAQEYVSRTGAYADVAVARYRGEADLLKRVAEQRGRTPSMLALLDSRGKLQSSEEFAAWLGRLRDSGQQSLVLAVGPADGWSAEARKRADFLISLGPMTLPHELAQVVLSEQVYRAFTILSGHPYHGKH
jgi:23S rRNA (pseudouridine1915-N3)-methyltransferase